MKQDLVDQLPDKVEISESHLSLYRLVSRYRQNGPLNLEGLLPAGWQAYRLQPGQ
ncbi:hypothetical protein [Lactobacillus delbrueckii]|uniref:hypothetical protein n=1 Tax=Lactobacillus delbrueckii TaxID=1584 RepID=UPI0025A18320|nr:hypothetical protein [Lactobacillus delbrueckii]MDM7511382.1 hypothetical protein [Lactobacillus delbrueckii]WKZ98888.1 hypothetical protein MJT43_02930 [Lactobacillus delbrueckii]